MRRSLQGVDFIPPTWRNGQLCAQYGLSTKLDSFVKMRVGQGILELIELVLQYPSPMNAAVAADTARHSCAASRADGTLCGGA
jgi:hypothetical protein